MLLLELGQHVRPDEAGCPGQCDLHGIRPRIAGDVDGADGNLMMVRRLLGIGSGRVVADQVSRRHRILVIR